MPYLFCHADYFTISFCGAIKGAHKLTVMHAAHRRQATNKTHTSRAESYKKFIHTNNYKTVLKWVIFCSGRQIRRCGCTTIYKKEISNHKYTDNKSILYSSLCPSALSGCHELAQYPEIIILVRFCRGFSCVVSQTPTQQTLKWPLIYKIFWSCKDSN